MADEDLETAAVLPRGLQGEQPTPTTPLAQLTGSVSSFFPSTPGMTPSYQQPAVHPPPAAAASSALQGPGLIGAPVSATRRRTSDSLPTTPRILTRSHLTQQTLNSYNAMYSPVAGMSPLASRRGVPPPNFSPSQLFSYNATALPPSFLERQSYQSPSPFRGRSRVASLRKEQRAGGPAPVAHEPALDPSTLVPPSSPGATTALPGTSSVAVASGGRTCNCKNSKCLKLYCECFANGEYCGPNCNCVSCGNREATETLRKQAIEVTLAKNPDAFRPKFGANKSRQSAAPSAHVKGCRCARSKCIKRYCECFQAGIPCTSACQCRDCHNRGDSCASHGSAATTASTAAPNSSTSGPSGAGPPAATPTSATPGTTVAELAPPPPLAKDVQLHHRGVIQLLSAKNIGLLARNMLERLLEHRDQPDQGHTEVLS
ncbi:uncharacterized protein MONBRDRAFT_29304 [Monosiga brevicollis MX1]|uniref:CRC domain-containing protein n=1 Tax=Monosiga brevicollis TaxID=81824 RepID=A9VAQ1_MONBE|nr:uncharacterized protein MONBRDRAFT_29304 [Monosiga brevicollis MX1]EDQ85361.1 predicted protein [Monosiga brevicollis MX1]|eukprot:XP_001749772.1 hypothetical protein [Monosiga brevicollis MX1]